MDSAERLDELPLGSSAGEVRAPFGGPWGLDAIDDGLAKNASNLRMVAEAAKGKRFAGYVGGWASLPTPDRQGDKVVQEGLDLSWLRDDGWFSDNHLPEHKAPRLGFPVVAELRDHPKLGKCLWVEGPILDTDRGRELMETIRSLRGTGRQYGFSVETPENPVRDVLDKKLVRSVRLWNVAITDRPCHPDTRISFIKSLAVTPDTVDAILAFHETHPVHARELWGFYRALLANTPVGNSADGMAALQREDLGSVAAPKKPKRRKRRRLTVDDVAKHSSDLVERIANHPKLAHLGLSKAAIQREIEAALAAA